MTFNFGKYAFLSLVAIMTLSAFGAEPPTAQELLDRARNSKRVSTYAKLHGILQHRRRGEEPQEIPIYFGVVIEPHETNAVIWLKDRNEIYTIRQTSAGRDGTSVESYPQNAGTLNYVGLRVSDLAMSFLHYKLVEELDGATLSAVVSCRVLLLESPDDQPGGKEFVKVYLEKDHAFPLKAEFFKNRDDKKPFRLMEANGFTKKNDLYYAKTILVEAPGLRTKVEFDPRLAEIGLYDKQVVKFRDVMKIKKGK